MTDVFAGTWELNPQRSEFDPNHRPTQGTMEFETDGNAYVLKAHGVSAKGQRVTEKAQRLIPDARIRHAAAAAPAVHGVGAEIACVSMRLDIIGRYLLIMSAA